MRRIAKRAAAERSRASELVRHDLVGGQQLRVERGGDADVITLVAPGGQIELTLVVTPAGPVLRYERGPKIEASGELELSGRKVAIRGESGVTIESGGDAAISVAGDLSSSARI